MGTTRYTSSARQLQLWGKACLASAFVLGTSLGVLYLTVEQQILQAEQWRVEARQVKGDAGTAYELYQRALENEATFYSLQRQRQAYDSICAEIETQWNERREQNPLGYAFLCVTSYLGTFRAPKTIASARLFTPGLVETVVLVFLGLHLLRRSREVHRRYLKYHAGGSLEDRA